MSDGLLIVDDDRNILELISLLLRERGFGQVRKAVDAVEALRMIGTDPPALVLMDYLMPGRDGLSLLIEIRQRFPETYVVVLTGQGNEEVAVEIMKAGASDYVRKPFKVNDLVERVENVLRMRSIELHNRELLAERERLTSLIEGWNRELEARVREKTRELEEAHTEMIQVEKLATLGHLAAGLAHEIRNPLNSILLFAQILKGAMEGTGEEEMLDRIQAEVERIDGLLVSLLATSRPTHRDMAPVDLSRVAQESVETFRPQIKAQQVRLNLQISTTSEIEGDKAELQQIFSNLISNALHAMPDGGVLTIVVRPDKGGVAVEVGDTGRGIPREHLNRVFDPFFTTRSKGTGFGLSVVLRIVKSYHGKIAVESEPGQGTTFRFLLPLAPLSSDSTP